MIEFIVFYGIFLVYAICSYIMSEKKKIRSRKQRKESSWILNPEGPPGELIKREIVSNDAEYLCIDNKEQ